MVKILNKLALIAAALGIIPIGLPFITINFTRISTGESTIVSVYPWGLVGGSEAVFLPVINLILFMLPVIVAPLLAIYGSTKLVGGRTLIGLAGFISAFGVFQWFIQLGAFIGTGSDIASDLSWIGGLNLGFYISIAATVTFFLSILAHPKPSAVTPDLELLQPYQLEEKAEGGSSQTGGYKFCPYCGEKIPSEAVFCPKCGSPTNISEAKSSNLSKEYDVKIEGGEEPSENI
ncbi:MAG: zinc-ribbon domain-containing protein [Candidatus Odinarchaeum yellowstonii]|uniref:Zinc-ribbon domain-containing protein n=1 Tax=Odinarchaeota yellowstonii (strain LCB_4) TaxID=1841599 RepID=A0AAF0IBT2_ODILC|nr:MAG: zinc-ribbon domain-containing protein [Candidatus Odinarchaeum yellowstonii]